MNETFQFAVEFVYVLSSSAFWQVFYDFVAVFIKILYFAIKIAWALYTTRYNIVKTIDIMHNSTGNSFEMISLFYRHSFMATLCVL